MSMDEFPVVRVPIPAECCHAAWLYKHPGECLELTKHGKVYVFWYKNGEFFVWVPQNKVKNEPMLAGGMQQWLKVAMNKYWEPLFSEFNHLI